MILADKKKIDAMEVNIINHLKGELAKIEWKGFAQSSLRKKRERKDWVKGFRAEFAKEKERAQRLEK